MRIGVVCEGLSDFPAISEFFGHSLEALGLASTFVRLFPDPDKTRPDGGWGNVLRWLRNHPADARVQQYFRGGIFGGSMSLEPLDAILVHLDSDVLGDDSFCTFVLQHHGVTTTSPSKPSERAEEITKILQTVSGLDALANSDRERHVIAPAVESTEAWCVAAFHPRRGHFERLRGEKLLDAFMKALESSEGRQPKDTYANLDKNPVRRQTFCTKHRSGSARIAASCTQFRKAIGRLAVIPTT